MNNSKFHRHPLQNELYINNPIQYQYFLKKNFKYTKNLQMARTRNFLYSYHFFSGIQNEIACKIRNKFLKVAQKMKFINHLDLAKSSEIFKLSKPKLLQIIKKFRDLKSLSFCEDPILEAKLRFTIFWLKRIKHLVSFRGNVSSEYRGVFDQKDLQKSKTSFKNAINSKDLKKLKLIINDGERILPFNVFPVTLREIRIDLQDRGRLGNKVILEKFEEDDVLGQYENLEELNFMIPTTAFVLSEMLDSIPNPSKIRSLGFCIALIPAHEYFEIANSFKRFKNLQSLDLRFLKNSLAIDLLEILEDFENLRNLKVSLLIKSEQDLITLGEILKRIENLQSLEIKIEGNISESVPEGFQDFFEGIGELSELEILKIHIDLYYKNNRKMIIEGSLKSFSECLGELNEIKEISFQQDHADWKREFGFLVKVLKKKGEKLRGLEIKAPWDGYPKKVFQCKEKEMMVFLKAIENMRELEKLVLTNFEIQEERITSKLFDIIKRLKKLREVYLKIDLLEAKSEMMEKVIQEMLGNSIIEDFVLTGNIKTEDLIVFDYKDFVVKKSKFKRIQCDCFDMKNFEFTNY